VKRYKSEKTDSSNPAPRDILPCRRITSVDFQSFLAAPPDSCHVEDSENQRSEQRETVSHCSLNGLQFLLGYTERCCENLSHSEARHCHWNHRGRNCSRHCCCSSRFQSCRGHCQHDDYPHPRDGRRAGACACLQRLHWHRPCNKLPSPLKTPRAATTAMF
jgi:hypothetical protein